MVSDPIKNNILKNRYIPTAEFYSQIIDSLHDYSIFTLDKELTINSWSSGSSIIFGYDTDEVIGEHFEIIFTDEDRRNGIPNIEIALALKEGRAVDNRWHIGKNGNRFYAYGLVFPLNGIDGELLGFVKILRDLTERKKSEEAIKQYVKELEELNTHKENILAIVSHDLRSPLSAIIGAAEYLKSEHTTMAADTKQDMIDLIVKASHEELQMLNYLVEWARIKYASEIFSPSNLLLDHYVARVFDVLSEVATAGTVSLHYTIDEGINVFADKKMLLTILLNIVSNAIKHSHPGGAVTVTATKESETVTVRVRDTGVGMSKETQKRIFTPQMNSLSKAREEHKGAGIGLLLVKGFLEKNGGTIWVESAPGEGSIFYFTLPASAPEQTITGTTETGVS
jgi:PAS domain S-box-containing protein